MNHVALPRQLRELHLFAGAGGGILAGMLLGHTTVCAVEIEPYPRSILLARQRDGILPRFPIWDDVTTFDGKPWRGRVDVVCGGFPCQDISAAGKGKGLSGERSGLWSHMARVIGEVEPTYVFVENSPMLTLRGLNRVLGDLSSMGYDARWGVVGGTEAQLAQPRDRIWILAYPKTERSRQRVQSVYQRRLPREYGRVSREDWFQRLDMPGILGSRDGMANWLDRHCAAGNGQIPAVAALAYRILSQ